MRIVFFSPSFLPKVGGLESVMRDWAFGLSERGYSVQVITLTANDEADNFPFEVYRCISQFKMWKLMRAADVVIQFNVSLKGILPCLLCGVPLIVSHHGTNFNILGNWHRFGRIKQFIANYLAKGNIACSAYVAQYLKNVAVVYDPYDESIFKRNHDKARSKDIIFLGRLVSDKGCDILIRALGELRRTQNLRPSLSIVGDGHERSKLEALVKTEGIFEQVVFAGTKTGQELARELNLHKLMVVPSVWEEPFGIVALEGLACGCLVIASRVGGLPEAVGELGIMFEKKNYRQLADVIALTLTNLADSETSTLDLLKNHLEKFTLSSSVGELISAIKKVINK